MNDNDRNKQTVRQFLELFSSGNVSATMAMMSDDATWWVAGSMPISGTHDKAAFTTLLSGVASACKGDAIRITPTGMTAEDGRVAVEAESLAHLHNGRTYNNHYHFLFTVRDGRIAGVKEYLDTMHAQAVVCTP